MNSPIIFMFTVCLIPVVLSIRCYQCASSENLAEDTCGAYNKFDTESHIAVECNSDESNMPGSFCMKLTQQGSKGFIWDGRWRQVIRRCASVAETGVTGVCNWGVNENGVYWEECYCTSDECNSSISIKSCMVMVISAIVTAFYANW
ncbi:unnamed protein product [Leptidea sinapis]|uniref:Uncharacterized protein n=1 Tax=Leptidea sinapis TaxID=189913 RepID=A0A5E4PYN5_9NEOP|nr:unnamed protein product [Leptidea sinapis]